MQKKTMTLTGLTLAAAIGAAQAADLGGSRNYPYAAPAPAPAYAAYNWMGPYIGANLGYQWGDVSGDETEPSGGVVGLQAGYNWQSGSIVFGAETDIQWSNAEDVVVRKFENHWFGTLRGRVGYAFNNILAYGTGGLAYGGLEMDTGALSESQAHYGWTLGVGAEVGLTPNWTARVEYLYFDLSERTYFTGRSAGYESSLMRAGVNYRF